MELTLPAKDSISEEKKIGTSANDENSYPNHTSNLFIIEDLKDKTKTLSITIFTPKTDDETMTCTDSTCTTFFKFANDAYPGFSHKQALGGAIENAGDLDNDGICELYFVPDWFTSNWTGLNIYSLKNNTWKKIASGSIRRQDGMENDSLYLPYDQRIIKHTKKYFELLENVMDEDGNEKLVPKRFNL